MPDNITAGGNVVATNEIDGVHHQRAKMQWGAAGVAADVSADAPLPVEDANSDAALAALQAIETAVGGTQTISGTVSVTGVATAANQTTMIGHVDGIETALAGTLAVSAASLPLPTGASTSDKQDTGNTALATLAGAVAGAEMQVDVLTLPNVTVGAALPAGANNIGDVDIASIAAGENLIGLVGAPDIVVTVTPTLDTNAYTSGDLLFDSTEIANAVRANGGCAILQSVTAIDKDDQKLAMTLLFADANTDFGTANSAPDPDDTEAATVLGHVAIATGDYVDLGGASVACIRGLGLLLKAGAATTSLYVAAITGGTPTHTASGLVLKIGLLRS